MNDDSIKKINIAIIVFSILALLFGVYLLVMSVNTYEEIVNDDISNMLAEDLKENSNSNNEMSNYDQQLKNNGSSLSNIVKSFSALFIIWFFLGSIFIILVNILVIVFALITIKRSKDELMKYFSAKFSVINLILSLLTLNIINVVLSIISIIKIRQQY